MRCNKNCFNEKNSKEAEATGDFIGNKTADKITSVSKELHLKKSSQNALKTDKKELGIPKERFISPEKKQQINDKLRLV